MMVNPNATSNASNGSHIVQSLSARAASILARWRYVLLAIVALAQAGVLAHMVVDRETLLANSRTIDLHVVPVDPRDLFRGDYVTLSYDISRVPRAFIDGSLRRGDEVYVRLAQQQGEWRPIAASLNHTEAGPVGAHEIIMKAHVVYVPSSEPLTGTSMMSVSYGIEKFFVPEGTGWEIEKEVRAKEVIAHVAVASDGTAALKSLTVAGKNYDLPPLF